MSYANTPAPHGATKMESFRGPEKPYVYQPYPGCRYHPDGRVATVNNVKEDGELGEPWADTPYPQEPAAPAAPELTMADLQAQIDELVEAARSRNTELLYLREENAALKRPKEEAKISSQAKRQAAGRKETAATTKTEAA